jgi:hypothetical protein
MGGPGSGGRPDVQRRREAKAMRNRGLTFAEGLAVQVNRALSFSVLKCRSVGGAGAAFSCGSGWL